ncbi:SCP-like extracellular [Altererythrobacter endophyticus]|uniref:SCP-like extracellular n=2 Tax=Altericroceibacterium endophyticum TaxID=1808508 RepID=A0A6I4T0I4_9SPHN|nr:SCP-like extracellular [Altericroceibacterium endophyticum]
MLVVSAHASRPDDRFQRTILVSHNIERVTLGLKPLHWNAQLADEANEWARRLAREGRIRHSHVTERKGAGENLWAGTHGYYQPQDIMNAFLAERRDFRAGVFPDVSRTGSWNDVGHYTQIIWPDTRYVGCASARGRSYDYVVCRYWPAGNIIGRRIAP